MSVTQAMNVARSLLKGKTNWTMTEVPPKATVKNASATTVTAGDLLMVDPATVNAAFDYTQVIVPTTAELGYGLFCVALTGGAADAPIEVLFFGDCSLNLAANSGAGAPFCAANAAKTATSTLTTAAKLLGRSKETGTGVKRVYFDGRGIGSGVVAASATVSGVVELATTAEAETGTDTVRAVTPAGLKAAILGLEQKTFWAESIYVGTTTPLVANTAEIATNSLCVNKSWDAADSGGDLIGWFDWDPPKRWDAGTITFQVIWSVIAATAGPCVFALDGGAVSDGDSLNLTVGTAATVTDSSSATANLIYHSPVSSALTIGGTAAKADIVKFRIRRTSGAAGDTNTATARILAVRIFFTTDAMTDD